MDDEMIYLQIFLNNGEEYIAKWITDTVDGMEIQCLETNEFKRLYMTDIQNTIEIPKMI